MSKVISGESRKVAIMKFHDFIETDIRTEINRTLVSEWAEEHRVLTEGPFQGPFSFDVVPYLREIADVLSPSDTETREVALMKPSRIGATVSVGENWIGAIIDAFPADVGYITSDGAMAEIQMQTRIDSLINESGIGDKIGDVPKRVGQKKTMDKTVLKAFPGGTLLAGGPNSSFFKRSVGFKFLNITEVDGFDDNIGKEGDPIGLFRRRCGAFANDYKILWESSPKLEHNSKILRLYKEGDQRKYFVPCKKCGHMQFLKWGSRKEKGGLKFKHDEEYRLIKESVYYECEECGEHWHNEDKDFFLPDEKMGGVARWKPTVIARKPGIKSFHLNALYAPIGFISWESIVMEMLEIKRNGSPPLELQVWINTVLGEPFSDKGEAPKIEAILTRERNYHAGKLPEDAKPLFLTLGADVQADRIEYEIVAWGFDKESWSVNYEVLPGDTSDLDNNCWQKLREIILSEHCGQEISLAAVDAGFRTQTVYEFADSFDTGVHPAMGSDHLRQQRAYIKLFKIENMVTARLDFNSFILTQEIYKYLNREDVGEKKRMGICHFPADYKRQHFLQLTAETLVKENNKLKFDNQGRRNEQLDCRKMNLACLYAIKQAYEESIFKQAVSWEQFWTYVKGD